MTDLKTLFRAPARDLTRKYSKEIHSCEQRVQKAESVDAPGLVHAYQRSIKLRKEYLSDSQKNLKDLLETG
jgi:hypothetical protein